MPAPVFVAPEAPPHTGGLYELLGERLYEAVAGFQRKPGVRGGRWATAGPERGHNGTTGLYQKVAHNFPRSVFKRRSKRCNSNDVNSKFEEAAGELRATLSRNHACNRPRGPDLSRRGPARIKDWGSRPPTHIRIGNEHPDRLITYPDVHNLSTCAQPIQISPEGMAGNEGPGEGTYTTRHQ